MARKEHPAERRARRAAIDDPAVVLNAAARYLEARSRSVAEVRRHLVDAGYRAALVEEAVGGLLRMGYLDDEAFAQAWVASRDRARPRGERALRLELVRKGIDDAIIRAVLGGRGHDPDAPLEPGAAESESGSADEAAAARLLERKRSTLLRAADARTARQKAYALLARNGFDPGVAARISERFMRGLADSADATDSADRADDGPLLDD